MEFRCRECNEHVDPDMEPVIIYHYPECFDKHVKYYQEYGIRIGMRVHKKKKKAD